jgi:23S rRNA pseudouridine1911/1915/1917 synthase
MYSASRLSTMVKNREIHRQYLAVAEGLVPDHGIIDAPIGRVDGSTIEREVNFETGDRAVTHYARLDYKNENGFSLVSLQLETGRTHQIRVHMNYIGHPLPGDFIYNPDYSIIKRQALHSSRLEFSHPVTGEPLHFTAPLPDDMKAFGFTD